MSAPGAGLIALGAMIGSLLADSGGGDEMSSTSSAPVVALLAGVIVAMFTMGTAIGASRDDLPASLSAAFPPIAGILLVVAAGGAGFWLVKQYFGLTVGETINSWSVMETVISVVGLVGVLLLSLVVQAGPGAARRQRRAAPTGSSTATTLACR
jgi:GntP family gluconate:H+ symporter